MNIDTIAAVTRDAVSKLSQADLGPAEFLYEVSTRVRRVVPHETSAWLTLDPDTMLPSGTLDVEEQKPPEVVRALWRNELLASDAHKLTDLARRPLPVAALSQLDASAAAQSERVQLIYGRVGVGDEMRVLLRGGGVAWGAVLFCRESGSRQFDDSERAFMADLAPDIGEGLQRSLSRRPDPDQAVLVPGVVAFDAMGSMTSATAEAKQMMALMPGDATSTLYAVALSASQRDGARARVRLSNGRWLLLHGGRMLGAPAESAHVTVTLMPAPPADITSLLLRLHGLSAREREVAELLMLGSSTESIAARLHISQHTLRDHVKAIFGKVGARSRSELMAMAWEWQPGSVTSLPPDTAPTPDRPRI
jgi:DNA-binding CsgD family transcriptional regulator